MGVEVLVQHIEPPRRGAPYAGPLDIALPTDTIPGATLAGLRRGRRTSPEFGGRGVN